LSWQATRAADFFSGINIQHLQHPIEGGFDCPILLATDFHPPHSLRHNPTRPLKYPSRF